MRELTNDPFYKLLDDYPRCIIDYCLIEDDKPNQGYRSHKDAVLFALLKVIERDIGTGETFPWSLDIGKAEARQIDPADLFKVPVIPGKDHNGDMKYDCELPDPLKGEQIPYWYAFWHTPHPSGYKEDDFRKVNSLLVPKGMEELEAYEWTTDWSNYFDEGHEWWGTACWSIYDRLMKRYVVIMASTTD